MNISNPSKKIKSPFTAIPNFIIEQCLDNKIAPVEFKMIAMFLSNRPGFDYNYQYFRKRFHVKLLQKYLPLLIANNFIRKIEKPIDKYRSKSVYMVRPSEDWAYHPRNQQSNPDDAPPIDDDYLDNLAVDNFEPEPSIDEIPPDDLPIFQSDLSADHNGNRYRNVPNSSEVHNGNRYTCVPEIGTLLPKDRYRSVPLNKTTQQKYLYKGGAVFENGPERSPLAPPLLNFRFPKSHLIGRLRGVYKFISRETASELITALRRVHSDEAIVAALAFAENLDNPKFFREYHASHRRLWFQQCESASQGVQIETMGEGNDEGNSEIAGDIGALI